MRKDEFRKLQQEWNKRLEESGFVDAEINDGREIRLKDIAWEACRNIYRRGGWEAISHREEYFRVLHQKAINELTIYLHESHRHILTRFSEGMKINKIIEELAQFHYPRTRGAIRFIIRRYEMEWGLRFYNKKELNRK